MARMAWLLASVLWVAGCGVTGFRKPYEPPRVAVPESVPVLLEAIHLSLLQQGFQVVEWDLGAGSLTALSPVEQQGKSEMRYRWLFAAANGEVTARAALEVRFDPMADPTWQRSTAVCVGYAYTREQAQLDRLADFVPMAQAALKHQAAAIRPTPVRSVQPHR